MEVRLLGPLEVLADGVPLSLGGKQRRTLLAILKIWNVKTGSLRLTLPAQGPVSDIAYSPDGRYLAATGPERFVTVYMMDLDELGAEAESRLTRWWSEAECLQYLQTKQCPSVPEGLSG